ncbi:MAG: response regulator [Deltaproteobacteria bacterium]|nr:response regulator [Deltaproteobacteria bacterium]
MGHRILVVDDDRNIGQILHASFSAKGYEVYISRNGEDALEQLEELRPDLVLLDVLLPKMNGWDVCRQIKSRENGTPPPVILMSAVYKTPKMQLEAKQKYGADEFVEKPFQLSSLMDMTVRLIGEPDAVAEAAPSAPADDAAAPAEEPAGGEAVVDDERVELEGTLDDVPFPELLHTLYVMGRPGRLEMTSDGKEKTISVMDGYPVSVRTNIDDELFGNYLVRQHVITAEQCAEAVKKMEASGRLLGTVLIEMDLLSPQQVVNYLRMQVRDKLFEIFSWPSGTYRFIEDRSVTGDLQNVEMSVANIINEGVRRHYPYGRVSAW